MKCYTEQFVITFMIAYSILHIQQKKNLNLDGAFSHNKFLCQLPVLGFLSDLIFACKYVYPIEANTHTTKQKAQDTHKQQQSNTECIHMYLLLCEMQHFDAS